MKLLVLGWRANSAKSQLASCEYLSGRVALQNRLHTKVQRHCKKFMLPKLFSIQSASSEVASDKCGTLKAQACQAKAIRAQSWHKLKMLGEGVWEHQQCHI